MSARPPDRAPRATLLPMFVALVALAIETGSAFLPWIRTGHRDRTSFELIGAARELDVLRSPLERVGAAAWYALPLLAAVAALAAALGARHALALAAVIAGGLGLAVGRGAWIAPFVHYAPLPVCIVSSGFSLLAGVFLLVSNRHSVYR